jgi:glycosyltransferase involved in cell wall biosynthesis
MISFIIPAYNEEALIGQTVRRLVDSADALGEPYEIIVVDDDSSDRTAELAREAGARVVSVKKRQIAAVRNAGAREAKGDMFIFVDADTLVPEPTIFDAYAAIQEGAVGGGALVEFDEAPRAAHWITRALIEVFGVLGLAAGCFIFCRRDAFEAVGGFDERYFASEEVWISRALSARGRFVMVRSPVVTSARKIRHYGLVRLLGISTRLLLGGPRAVQRREGLGIWYDGQREPPEKTPPESARADSTAAPSAAGPQAD